MARVPKELIQLMRLASELGIQMPYQKPMPTEISDAIQLLITREMSGATAARGAAEKSLKSLVGLRGVKKVGATARQTAAAWRKAYEWITQSLQPVEAYKAAVEPAVRLRAARTAAAALAGGGRQWTPGEVAFGAGTPTPLSAAPTVEEAVEAFTGSAKMPRELGGVALNRKTQRLIRELTRMLAGTKTPIVSQAAGMARPEFAEAMAGYIAPVVGRGGKVLTGIVLKQHLARLAREAAKAGAGVVPTVAGAGEEAITRLGAVLGGGEVSMGPSGKWSDVMGPGAPSAWSGVIGPGAVTGGAALGAASAAPGAVPPAAPGAVPPAAGAAGVASREGLLRQAMQAKGGPAAFFALGKKAPPWFSKLLRRHPKLAKSLASKFGVLGGKEGTWKQIRAAFPWFTAFWIASSLLTHYQEFETQKAAVSAAGEMAPSAEDIFMKDAVSLMAQQSGATSPPQLSGMASILQALQMSRGGGGQVPGETIIGGPGT